MRYRLLLATRFVPGVVGVLIVALLAGGLMLYRPSVSPPGMQARHLFTKGVAKQSILVDTQTSTFVDRDQTILGPPDVALTYALYLQTDGARALIAASVDQPMDALATSGPFTELLPKPNLVVQRVNPVPEPPKPSDRQYRLLLDVAEDEPVLTIYAQAPTEAEARRMVDSAGTVLAQYIAQRDPTHVPEDSRSILRPLGGTDAATIDRNANLQLAIGVFLLVIAGAGLLAYRGARRRRRQLDAELEETPEPLAEEPAGSPRARALDDWPNTTRLLPWLLAGFLVMIYVLPFGAIEVPMPLPGDGVLDRPVIMVMTFVWICGLTATGSIARPRVQLTRVHYAIAFFFLICLFSAALNADALAQIGLLGTGLKKLVVLVNYLMLFLIAASSIRAREVPRFMALLAVLSGITALGTIWESRFDYNVFFDLSAHLFPGMVSIPDDLHGLDEIGRATIYGPTSQPLELATLLALSVPFAVLGVLDASTRKRKVWYGILLALLLAADFSTGRKSSVLVPAVGLLVILFYRPGALKRLLPVGAFLVVFVNVLAPGMLWSLYFQLSHVGAVKSTQARSADYDAVWSDVTSHLLVGRGFKTFDPHVYRILDNEYLGLLIGVGLIGVVAFLGIFAAIASSAHRTIKSDDRVRRRYALAISAVVISAAFASFLFDMLSFPHVPYLIFLLGGMVLALRNTDVTDEDDVEPQLRTLSAPPPETPAPAPPARVGV
ncbi:MAG TPA: O-antigen ligase family protein [Baekduia sp.]